jgi:DNA helicase INO80
VQSISLLAWLAETNNIWGPFLIVAPASTLHNWQQEFSKFTPFLKTIPYWGNIKDRKTLRKFWNMKKIYGRDSPFHVVITSYQIIVTDQPYFQRIKWQYMILDEAHAIKSSTTTRWKTLMTFRCRNRLLLTGTPIQNSMQELWALLHFIMPTLFDSHEEFSEWFSKDIETNASEKGKLNQHQLNRLHMILKPFMLRRVKKEVEHELGEKIEKTIYCDLTSRQKRMYEALNEKISIDELLEKASFEGTDDLESNSGLMNLVMQFRKVCNHPQIFEAAEVQSPFVFTISNNERSDQSFLSYKTRNPISFTIPRLLFESNRVVDNSENVCSRLVETKTFKLMKIWSSFNLHENKGFGFLKFIDVSIGEADMIFSSSLVERTLRLYQRNSTRKKENSFLLEPNAICFDLNDAILSSVSKTESGYLPKVVAEPIDFYCNHASFTIIQNHIMFNNLLCAVFSNLRDYIPRKYKLDILNNNSLIPQPLGPRHGYTPIIVPNAFQLLFESGKLRELDGLLIKLKQEGHRVLIYFQMTKMIDLMEEYLTYKQYSYLRLDGSSKISDRRDMVSDWQNNPDIFVFLLSTRAGGLGINLTAADTVIFYDSDWNPTVDQQAMDRAHRLGQTRQVTVYRMVSRGTIEERILQRAIQKDEIQKVVIAGGVFAGNLGAEKKEEKE